MDTVLKVRQFQYENDSTKRMLEFLLQENAILKTRLAELLPEKDLSEDFLEMAELYQTWFVQKDEIINFMRHDIGELNNMLIKFIHESGNLKYITGKQKKLRNDLRSLELAFNELKLRFNNYLESIFE